MQTIREEKVLLTATLCYLWKKSFWRKSRFLLAQKTRGICKDKYNGYGGGLENGESLKECCARELFKESHLIANPKDFKKVAVVYFHNTKTDGVIFVCKVTVYFLYEWKGKLKESDEMVKPRWNSKNNPPWQKMAAGDKYWLPPVLLGEKVIAHVPYSAFQEKINGPIRIERVESFPNDD